METTGLNGRELLTYAMKQYLVTGMPSNTAPTLYPSTAGGGPRSNGEGNGRERG